MRSSHSILFEAYEHFTSNLETLLLSFAAYKKKRLELDSYFKVLRSSTCFLWKRSIDYPRFSNQDFVLVTMGLKSRGYVYNKWQMHAGTILLNCCVFVFCLESKRRQMIRMSTDVKWPCLFISLNTYTTDFLWKTLVKPYHRSQDLMIIITLEKGEQKNFG